MRAQYTFVIADRRCAENGAEVRVIGVHETRGVRARRLVRDDPEILKEKMEHAGEAEVFMDVLLQISAICAFEIDVGGVEAESLENFCAPEF